MWCRQKIDLLGLGSFVFVIGNRFHLYLALCACRKFRRKSRIMERVLSLIYLRCTCHPYAQTHSRCRPKPLPSKYGTPCLTGGSYLPYHSWYRTTLLLFSGNLSCCAQEKAVLVHQFDGSWQKLL